MAISMRRLPPMSLVSMSRVRVVEVLPLRCTTCLSPTLPGRDQELTPSC